MVACVVAVSVNVLVTGCGSGSIYTAFPPAKDATSQPICFGSDGGGIDPIIIWISKRGTGQSSNDHWNSNWGTPSPCRKPPKHWLPLPHALTVVRRLYRMARREGFGTMPTSAEPAWKHQNVTWCKYNCVPLLDFMEFGGRTVFDGNGYSDVKTCPESGRFLPPHPRVPKRFLRIFEKLASMTNYCGDLDAQQPAE